MILFGILMAGVHRNAEDMEYYVAKVARWLLRPVLHFCAGLVKELQQGFNLAVCRTGASCCEYEPVGRA